MGTEHAGGIYVIVATEGAKTRYWAAAVPASDAIEAVWLLAPVGWTLRVTTRRLTPKRVADLKMRPNSV